MDRWARRLLLRLRRVDVGDRVGNVTASSRAAKRCTAYSRSPSLGCICCCCWTAGRTFLASSQLSANRGTPLSRHPNPCPGRGSRAVGQLKTSQSVAQTTLASARQWCGSKGAYSRPSYPCHYCTYRGGLVRQRAADKAKGDDQRHAGERQHHHLQVRVAAGGKQRKIVH